MLLLSQRDVRRRFTIAKWSMIVLELTATFALIALFDPPAAKLTLNDDWPILGPCL